MTTSTTPTDAAARARALDATQSFIVQAPAGSGKTGLLIQRLLVLLAHVDDPEKIVAITFTRKAAGEIRQRVTEALAAARNNQPPTAPHARKTWELARAALANAEARAWDLSTQRLQARTIDAFCETIARRVPLVSGHGDGRQTVDDARPLYREAIRRLLRSGAASVSALLWHLDNDVPQFYRLFESLLGHRDQWVRHLAAEPDELRRSLEETLRRVAEEHCTELDRSAPPFVGDAVAPLLTYADAQLQRTPTADPVERWTRIAELCLTKTGSVRAKVDRRQGFPAAKDADDPKLAKERKSAIVGFLGDLASPAARAFIDRLAEVPGLPPAHYDNEQWQVVAQLGQLVSLLLDELQRIFAERKQVDHTEVAGAAIAALEARRGAGSDDLRTSGGESSDPSRSFDVTHLLVDEFQDTSVAQYRLLALVTHGWRAGDGRTLFLVGDPMQSIYRFREANVELFRRCQRSGLEGLPVEPLTLTENFRSAAGVVDAVNEIFAEAFDPARAGEPGAVEYTPFRAHPGVEGSVDEASSPTNARNPAVQLHAWSGDDRGGEAERVADLVEAAKAQGHRSIAILVRSRHHLDVVLPTLRERGIRYQAVDFELLGARSVVRDLQALTGAIVSPADRVSWLAVLRAPWCGVTLCELEQIAETDGLVIADAVRSIANGASTVELSAETTRRVRRTFEIVDSVARERGRGSLRDRVAAAWFALGAPSLLTPTEVEEGEQFLSVLDDVAVDGELPCPEELALRLGELFAAVDAGAEDVEVMTIHRSKGLEFDCVIVPGLGRAPRPTESRLLLWDEASDGALLLGPMQSRRQLAVDPIYGFLRRRHRSKDLHELRRLLYVATTRARRELHLLGHLAPREDGDERPHAGSALSVLGDSLVERFRQQIDRDLVVPVEVRPQPPRARRLAASWEPPLPARSVVGAAMAEGVELSGELSVERERGRSLAMPMVTSDVTLPKARQIERRAERAAPFGTVLHRILAAIANGDRGSEKIGRDAIVAALVREGTPPEFARDDAEEIAACVERTLEDPRGAWILRPHRDGRCEWEVGAIIDGAVRHVRIDRTFVAPALEESGGDPCRWIVDYKSVEPPAGRSDPERLEEFYRQQCEQHAEQLRTYAAVVTALCHQYPTRQYPLRLVLYYPRFRGWREMAL